MQFNFNEYRSIEVNITIIRADFTMEGQARYVLSTDQIVGLAHAIYNSIDEINHMKCGVKCFTLLKLSKKVEIDIPSNDKYLEYVIEWMDLNGKPRECKQFHTICTG